MRRRWVNRKSCPSTRQINPDPNRHREGGQPTSTRQIDPYPDRSRWECRQAAIPPTRQMNRVPKSRLRSFNNTGVFREAINGRVQIIRFFGVTDLSGTIESGGEAITRASFSVSADGTIGMQATGVRRGVTIRGHAIPTTARFTLMAICRPIRWSPTFSRRCGRKAIMTPKPMACLDRLRVPQSSVTSATTVSRQPQQSIDPRRNP